MKTKNDALKKPAASAPVFATTKLPKKIDFSRPQLLIIAVALGLIGVIALLVSFALTPGNGDFEAESMTVTADTTPTPPPTPSGGGTWPNRATATTPVPLNAAIYLDDYNNNTTYRNTFLNNFDGMTAEWEFKFQPTEPSQNQFNFNETDQFMNIATTKGKYLRGHTFLWYIETPDWITGMNKTNMLAAIQNHINVLEGRYKGKIGTWDVVNEAFTDLGPGRRSNAFQNTIGDEYIEDAFKYARTADPSAKLFYNDYGIEGTNTKSTAVYNMAKDFKNRGIPIDGVGMQFHLKYNEVPSLADMKSNFKRFGDLGLAVEITELDIDETGSNNRATDLTNAYTTIAQACYQSPNCQRMTVWGISDLDSYPGAAATPLLFDTNYNKKPAYTAVRTALGW